MHVTDAGAEEFFQQYYNNFFDWDEEKQGDILWEALYLPAVYRVRRTALPLHVPPSWRADIARVL